MSSGPKSFRHLKLYAAPGRSRKRSSGGKSGEAGASRPTRRRVASVAVTDTSALVLGTMYFGTRTDRTESFRLLDRFVEAGGTTLDTANAYAFWASEAGAGGQSETVIGEWLRTNPGVRERLTIATKVGVEPVTAGDFTRLEGLSPDVVRRAAEQSLDRLGIDVIDLEWAHAPDPGTPLEQTVEAMGALVADGLAARLGASNFATWQVERARSHAVAQGLEPFTALQLTTSYVEPRPGARVEGKDHAMGWVSDETRSYVAAHPEIELWAYSPLVQGSYDRPDRPFPEAYDHPGTTRRLAALTEVAERLGVARSTVVLAWLVRRGIRPIVGVSSVQQLDAALAAGGLGLDDELMAQLDAPA